MGLLDDAIREHLDLKRRRGGDPTDIERAEREALGPVRRGPEAAQEPVDEAADVAAYDHEEPAEASAYDHEGDRNGLEAEHASAEPEWGLELSPPPPAEPPPASGSSLLEPAPSRSDEPPAAPVRARDPEPPAPVDHGHGGQETVEYDVEHHELQEKGDDEVLEKKDDDVLEETPEFLQDTPEHDRLWFEQKPPRDFDFNG